MAMKEEFEERGNWLFRHRGVFPFLIIPLLVIALKDSEYLERTFGNHLQTVWEVFCISLSILGGLVRCLTLGWIAEGTSGRNTKGQMAETLNTEGMYSIVRHPLYLGNFLIVLGMVLFVQVWWFVIIFVLLFSVFYERIMLAEEAFLRQKFGQQFLDWSSKTPAFFPKFSAWKTPEKHFSFRMVFKREYSTLLGVIIGFIALKFSGNLLAENELKFKLSWIILLAIGTLIYFVLRFIRKKTRLLAA
ncbi:MAG: hypothetical protein HY586_00550 [Candidatus Omnitrophica bacterium]|nr:hypothetical protein [Candidatus Omnitrophota bacterium]